LGVGPSGAIERCDELGGEGNEFPVERGGNDIELHDERVKRRNKNIESDDALL
jgi:hypothetical protein